MDLASDPHRLPTGRVSSTTDTSDPSRSISRISRACERCRLRKVRCDGRQQCARCQEHNSACTYRLGKSRIRPPAPRLRPSRPVASPSKTRSPAAGNIPTELVPRPPFQTAVPHSSQWHEGTTTGIGVSNSETGAFQFYGISHSRVARFQSLVTQYDRPLVPFRLCSARL